MNTAQTLKQNLKKTARQFADEPLELLKNAKRQIVGEENEKTQNFPEFQNSKQEENQNLKDNEYKQKKAESEGRTLQALESELKDIRRQKLFNDLMVRIQNGEDVPLEEFAELSFEQKDVLKAQIEVVKTQKLKDSKTQSDQLIEPVSKKGRQLFGQKKAAEKQTTRVEKPVPPSG